MNLRYGLFIIAFAVVTASLIKSQKPTVKKSLAKRAPLTLEQWPGVMKKSMGSKLPIVAVTNSKAVSTVPVAQNAAVSQKKHQARGIASVSQSNSTAQPVQQGQRGAGKYLNYYRTGANSGSFYYGVGYNQAGSRSPASAASNRLANYSQSDVSMQELSSFTRTPDLSMNPSLDPEMAESFEDQIRKFREQNQLSAQELQELELITNTFASVSNSVQRGQVPMQQVNAQAIKITRSFINLKRRVERRAQQTL